MNNSGSGWGAHISCVQREICLRDSVPKVVGCIDRVGSVWQSRNLNVAAPTRLPRFGRRGVILSFTDVEFATLTDRHIIQSPKDNLRFPIVTSKQFFVDDKARWRWRRPWWLINDSGIDGWASAAASRAPGYGGAPDAPMWSALVIDGVTVFRAVRGSGSGAED